MLVALVEVKDRPDNVISEHGVVIVYKVVHKFVKEIDDSLHQLFSQGKLVLLRGQGSCHKHHHRLREECKQRPILLLAMHLVYNGVDAKSRYLAVLWMQA